MWYINFALETRIFYNMVGCVELWYFFFVCLFKLSLTFFFLFLI